MRGSAGKDTRCGCLAGTLIPTNNGDVARIAQAAANLISFRESSPIDSFVEHHRNILYLLRVFIGFHKNLCHGCLPRGVVPLL